MDLKNKNIGLHRKAEISRQEYQARAMTVAKALRLSAAKAADALFELPLSVIGLTKATQAHSGLSDLIADGDLMMLLDGPGRKVGAVWIDPQLVGGLIQQQTTGTVKPAQEGDPRPMTATDAAMCAPLIDDLFKRAAKLPETPEERSLLEGYRFGVRAEEKRILLMALDVPDYEVLSLTFDLDGGVRQGRMTLCLPPAQSAPEELDETTDEHPQIHNPVTLHHTVLKLEVDLVAALTRLRLPLSSLMQWAPGDVIPLKINSLDEATVLTAEGRLIGKGALGQIDGVRALRIEPTATQDAGPMRRASDRSGLPTQGFETMVDQADPTFHEGLSELTPLEDPGMLEFDSGAMDALPDMPKVFDVDDISGMPDMSDLPELSGDLPPLDVPDLPKVSVG